MHSLTTLNGYSQSFMEFTDDRTYAVIYRADTSVTGIVTIAEDQSHTVRWLFDIEEIINLASSGGTISVELELPNEAGCFANFQTVAPSGVVISDDGAGTFTVSGIDSMSDWVFVRDNLTVKPPADRTTTWTYDVSIITPGLVADRNWTLTIEYPSGNVAEMLAPLDQEFDPQVAALITSTVEVLDPYNVDESLYTYRVVITPDSTSNLDLITTSATGGTTSWDNINKTFTIEGVKSVVNDHLESLTLTSSATADWVLTYTLTNILSNVVTVVTQNFVESVENLETTNLGIARSYTSNKINDVFASSVPQIDDGVQPGTPTYTVSLTLADDIGEIQYTGFSSAEWNQGTLTWTYSGTESQCNTALTAVKFYPHRDTVTFTTLRYQQWRATTLQADDTVNYTGVANTGAIPGTGTYTFTSTGTFTPTYEQAHYLDYEVLAVGGGGAGGQRFWNNISGTVANMENYYAGDIYDTSSNLVIGGGGSGGVVNITNSTYPIFVGSDGTTVYDITIGSGGTQGTVRHWSYYNVSSEFVDPGAGGDTLIERSSDGHDLARAYGGQAGRFYTFLDNPVGTYPNYDEFYDDYSNSGYGQVDNGSGGYASTSIATAPTKITYSLGEVDEADHPYDLANITDIYSYNDPDNFTWYNKELSMAHYRGGGLSVTSSISGSSVVYAEGGGLAYYDERANQTSPGAGGLAGLYDPGPDQTANTSDDDEGYTSGQAGIVIIKFTQP